MHCASMPMQGIMWMMRKEQANMGGMLADDTGIGKTLQSIGLIKVNHTRGPTLIVTASAELEKQWKKALEDQDLGPIMITSKKMPVATDKSTIVVTHYEVIVATVSLMPMPLPLRMPLP